LQELFPDYRFLPNQHMALHLSEYLQFYGPVHAWWTFPFERLIGMLQRIPNNFQDDKIAETMATSFTKSSNLRAILLKSNCPTSILKCSHHFTKFIDPQIQTTLLTDISRFAALLEDDTHALPKEVTGGVATVDPEVYRALRRHFNHNIPVIQKVLSYSTLHGVTYSIASRHQGNSFILCPSAPAQIEYILQTDSEMLLFVVRHFLKADRHDPFAAYPHIHSSLWSHEMGKLVVVEPSTIEAHFAGLRIEFEGKQYLVVISLSREY